MVVASLSVLAGPSSARAQLVPEAGGVEARAGAGKRTAWWERVDLFGYVDAYAALGSNHPADGTSFFDGVGTSAKAADSFGLNLAAIGVGLEPEPVGARLVLHAGTSTEVAHAREPVGPFTGPDVWKWIQEASISVRAPVARGLRGDLGIVPLGVGFEGFATKGNWNYTRSYLADLSPYYGAGLKAALSLTREYSVTAFAVNGWQTVGDANRGKTLGVRLQFRTDEATIALAGLAGPELPDDDEHWRTYADLVAELRPARWLAFALCTDVGIERRSEGLPLTWTGVAAYARATLLPPLSIALRGELFDDPRGAMTGVEQRLAEGTATVELRPLPPIGVKLEGRYDRSTARVFSGSETLSNGAVRRERDQALLVLGAVVSF